MTEKAKMEFSVRAQRLDAHGGLALCKESSITLDTALAGRRDAFNPAELLLAALGACMLKGIERVVPILKFELRGMEVRLHAIRQDVPPQAARVAPGQVKAEFKRAGYALEKEHAFLPNQYFLVFRQVSL